MTLNVIPEYINRKPKILAVHYGNTTVRFIEAKDDPTINIPRYPESNVLKNTHRLSKKQQRVK